MVSSRTFNASLFVDRMIQNNNQLQYQHHVAIAVSAHAFKKKEKQEKQPKNNRKTIKHHTKQHRFINFGEYIPPKQTNLEIARARYLIHT